VVVQLDGETAWDGAVRRTREHHGIGAAAEGFGGSKLAWVLGWLVVVGLVDM
jgi:hypothetical protein